MDRCGRCDRLVDTDEDLGFYVGVKDRPICEPCRDGMVMCQDCEGDGFIGPRMNGYRCWECDGEGFTDEPLEATP